MACPTKYTAKLGAEIARRLAQGESLRSICKSSKTPHISTVLEWALDSSHPFSEQYARAREAQGHTFADEIRDIANEVRGGLVDPNAARVAIDAAKWLAGRQAPKRYGDRVDVSVSTPAAALTDADLAEIAREVAGELPKAAKRERSRQGS